MEPRYFVYILRCSDDSYYIGYTNNLEKRVIKHNNGKAAKYTRGRRPVTVVYSERHNSKNSAMLREFHLKKLSRTAKEALIAGNFTDDKNTVESKCV